MGITFKNAPNIFDIQRAARKALETVGETRAHSEMVIDDLGCQGLDDETMAIVRSRCVRALVEMRPSARAHACSYRKR